MWYVHTCVMKWLKPKGIFLALIGQSGGRWCVVLGEIIHTGVLRFSVIWSRGIRLILDAWPLTMCAQAEVVRAGSLTHSPADFVYIWRIKVTLPRRLVRAQTRPRPSRFQTELSSLSRFLLSDVMSAVSNPKLLHYLTFKTVHWSRGLELTSVFSGDRWMGN